MDHHLLITTPMAIKENMVSVETWFIIFICIDITIGLIVLNWLITFVILYTKNVPQILARYPKPVILCSICFSIQLLITTPMAMIINGILIEEERYPALDITYSVLSNVTYGAMSWLFIYRVWIVYYDIQWNIALEDAEWQLHIDAHLQQNSNWFLRKKGSWGNSKRCAFILFTIWSCFSIAIITWVSINGLQKHKEVRYMLAMPQMYIFPLIFFIAIACKLPPFNDVYSLRKEVKYVLMIWICYIILFFVSGALLNPDHGTVDYAIVHFELAIWLSVLSYMLLPWSLTIFNLPTNVWSAVRFHYNVFDLNTYLYDKNKEAKDDKMTELSYLNILKDDAGFRAYTKHLSKSYAVENLLFILEIYQFKLKVKSLFASELCGMDTDNMMSVSTDRMEITESAPKSTLVAQMDSNDDNNVKDRVCICMSLLFMKYIQSSAYFCINLSYQTRNELIAKFGYKEDQKSDIIEYIKSKSEAELYTLFDKAINEICALLNRRFALFKKSNEFDLYKQSRQ